MDALVGSEGGALLHVAKLAKSLGTALYLQLRMPSNPDICFHLA